MNGSTLGSLLVAALLVAYLIWKRRTERKRSEMRSDPDPEPASEPQVLTSEPATAPDQRPVQDDAATSAPLASAEALPIEAGSEEESAASPETEIDRGEPAPEPAPVSPMLDKVLQLAELTGVIAEQTTTTDKGADRIEAAPATSGQETVACRSSEESEEMPVAAGAINDASPAATIQAQPSALTINLTLDAYASRMNSLEDRQRTLLAQAIVDRDEGLRDRLHRELVIINGKLTLIADSHAEAVTCFQQVLDILVQLREESGQPLALDGAVADLCDGNAESAETCLAEWDGPPPAMAGKVAFSRGQLAECRVDLQQALAQYRQAVALEPDNPRCLHAAGRVARMLYNYQEAIPWLESLVRLTRQDCSDDPLALAFAQRELAYTYILAGQHQKAGPLYKESMLAMARKLGQDHLELANCWLQIGELQETLGVYDKAVSLYRKALAIFERQKGAEHPALAAILAKLAALCMELEMEAEAVPLYERLVRIQEKTLRANHLQLAISLGSLGESYRLVGRYEDAESCYQKILAIHEATYGPDHPSVAAVLQELAKLNSSLRRPEEARQYQERASTIYQKSVEAQQKKSGDESLTLEL